MLVASMVSPDVEARRRRVFSVVQSSRVEVLFNYMDIQEKKNQTWSTCFKVF